MAEDVFFAQDADGVLRRWYPNRELAQLREIARHARVVMTYLEEDGASVVPHLMDSDDNPGQRLRSALDAYRSDALTDLARMGQDFENS